MPYLAAQTITAHFTSTSTVPLTSAGYDATGKDVALSLGFAPGTGCELTVVENTALPFIQGEFGNLAHGQEVALEFNGIVYRFVANYYGGNGNDLVLQWLRKRVFAWGSNSESQLARTSASSQSTPVLVEERGALEGRTVLSVSAGTGHALALCADGGVVAWGQDGLLGDLLPVFSNTTLPDSPTPVHVIIDGDLFGKKAVAVSAGVYVSVALFSDGTVADWGPSNSDLPEAVDFSSVSTSGTVVAVSAGRDTCHALFSDGVVADWRQGQTPVAVDATGALAGKSVVAITAGGIGLVYPPSEFCIALCSDGSMVAWGDNGSGQLGNNSTTASAVPVAVDATALAGKTVVEVKAGGAHVLARCDDGTLAAWGENSRYYQLGLTRGDRLVPTIIPVSGALVGKTVTNLTAGGESSMARCSDGAVVAWGSDRSGELGSIEDTFSREPVLVLVDQTGVLFGHSIDQVELGDKFCLALASVPAGPELSDLTGSSGNLWPEFSPAVTSYSIGVDPAVGAVTLTPSARDAAVIEVDGVPVVTGQASAPIPIGSSPVVVEIEVTPPGGTPAVTSLTITPATSVSAVFASATDVPFTEAIEPLHDKSLTLGLSFSPEPGQNLTVVRKPAAQPLQGWFSNISQGQSVTLSHGGKNFRYVANYHGGSGNDLVLEWADRALFGWGSNTYGTIGDGSNVSSPHPVRAVETDELQGRTIVQLASAAGSAFALCADGALFAWGDNSYGQLGLGFASDSKVPVRIDQLGALKGRRIVSVAAGNITGMAICSDGAAVMWGDNSYGQFGIGSRRSSSMPVRMDLGTKFVVQGALGLSHSIVVCLDGSVRTAGSISSYGGVSFPIPVSLNGRKAVSAGAGFRFDLVLCDDGTLLARGNNSEGALGNDGEEPADGSSSFPSYVEV
ncbi:MAG: cadherin-like beta sandwich domain-containing protein, partial [Verrucomicrobiae bacterium]|nr:cadherin-like beta sandwich domain-containing protein [Verrucomicrobiae bacterium]